MKTPKAFILWVQSSAGGYDLWEEGEEEVIRKVTEDQLRVGRKILITSATRYTIGLREVTV